ncbi:hypothetical protein EJ04DRAFT_110232 [Polyplosphaeria fusca]|uniref:Uncharacterized protein n=1 Tax=Polyplosphaeria fusca TaxID=682080 RepID=A0A9P4UWT4_9PLEO|nr:hypothetical protein EJ04DRAFT_110232 [Polyplosphaeria fusca]
MTDPSYSSSASKNFNRPVPCKRLISLRSIYLHPALLFRYSSLLPRRNIIPALTTTGRSLKQFLARTSFNIVYCTRDSCFLVSPGIEVDFSDKSHFPVDFRAFSKRCSSMGSSVVFPYAAPMVCTRTCIYRYGHIMELLGLEFNTDNCSV